MDQSDIQLSDFWSQIRNCWFHKREALDEVNTLLIPAEESEFWSHLLVTCIDESFICLKHSGNYVIHRLQFYEILHLATQWNIWVFCATRTEDTDWFPILH